MFPAAWYNQRRKRNWSGDWPGLQSRRFFSLEENDGFDSHTLPPSSAKDSLRRRGLRHVTGIREVNGGFQAPHRKEASEGVSRCHRSAAAGPRLAGIPTTHSRGTKPPAQAAQAQKETVGGGSRLTRRAAGGSWKRCRILRGGPGRPDSPQCRSSLAWAWLVKGLFRRRGF